MTDAVPIAHLPRIDAHPRAHLCGQDHVVTRAAAVFMRGELSLTYPTVRVERS